MPRKAKASWTMAAAAVVTAAASAPAPDVRFITLDPGHFHASLVQKEMYPGVSPTVHVYAPLGSDLTDHLGRISRFNLRKDAPTAWQLEVHTGPDFLERMLKDRPGNAVVLSGRNRGKIERIQASLDAGLHALVDKPWILEVTDLPRLEKALATADGTGRVALDIMTERFEVSSELQRELVNDSATFGTLLPGSEAEPAVYMESVHHLMKTVAGAPNIRPVWFFDSDQQGEGLNDIGTHLVDLVQWTLFPEQSLDHRKDLKILGAYRWPTMIPRAEFRRVTREDFPPELAPRVKADSLEYFCNTFVVVHAARRPRLAERDLGLGSAGGGGRLPLRVLPRLAREDRGAPGRRREKPARGLRRAEQPLRQGGGAGGGPEEDRRRPGPLPGHRREGPGRRAALWTSRPSCASGTRTISRR